jgi:D-3-phosphoglycerate dehydrogenase
VAAKLIRYSDNGSTVTAVNFPEVSLPQPAGQSRLLHIHRNVPGMLARINELFSQGGINVAAQYLRTNEHVGYVVMDVDAQAGAVAYDALCGIPGTIRCRVLY